MSQQSTPSSKAGWKALALAFVLGFIFLGFFYMAVSNEPDYMPSHKYRAAQENAQSGHAHGATTPAATAEEHSMSAEEHANMDSAAHQATTEHSTDAAHGH